MIRFPVRKPSKVGPTGSLIRVQYERDMKPNSAKRSSEVQDLVSEIIRLAHKRGRVAKDKEELLDVA